MKDQATNFLHSLKLQFAPPKINDPDFGPLLYMYISNHPERSYWECEWLFPKTKTDISISLPGDESGPTKEARSFYLGLASRFEKIIELSRPKLEEAFVHWIKQPLPEDIFKVVELAGFNVEDPSSSPINWNIMFETTGDKWVAITIPFTGDLPQDAVVDT